MISIEIISFVLGVLTYYAIVWLWYYVSDKVSNYKMRNRTKPESSSCSSFTQGINTNCK